MAPQEIPEPLAALAAPIDAGFAAMNSMMTSFNAAMSSVLSGLQAPFRAASPEPPVIMAIKAPFEAIKAAFPGAPAPMGQGQGSTGKKSKSGNPEFLAEKEILV